MKLMGNRIYLRFLEERDAAAKLDLNLRNRSFFESYLTTRTADFYTMDYQLQSIRSGLASKERDEGYFFWRISERIG